MELERRPRHLRYLILIVLSFSSWSGGVVFREIQNQGLSLGRAVTITTFALLSVGIASIIAREMRPE